MLLQACGSANTPTSEGIRAATLEPVRRLRLREQIDAIAQATSVNASNALVIENVLGDAADGEATPRVDVSETRFNALREIWVTITTDATAQMRRYVAEDQGDGTTLYIKGPSPDVGVEDDGWRVTQNRDLIDDRLNSIPSRVLPGFLPDPDALEPAFGPPEPTEIDGIACAKHSAPGERLPADLTAGVRAMFSRVDALTFTVTLCADGFLRALHIAAAGMGTTDAGKPGSVDVRLSFSGFNAASIVTAPPVFTPLDESAMPGAAQPATATARSDSAPVGPLRDVNDGSFGTSEPIVGLVTDLIPVKVDSERGELNYMSNASLDALFDFYQTHYTDRGLTEREFVTARFADGFSIVFDGLPDGAAMVVQATRVDAKNVNVNISKRVE